MDSIFIHDLRIETLVGIYAWERKVPQTLQFDIEVTLPSSRACETDDFRDTIDYSAVVAHVREQLAQKHFSLLEAMADHLARSILERFGAPWISLAVAKLEPVRGVKRLGVRVERGKRPA